MVAKSDDKPQIKPVKTKKKKQSVQTMQQDILHRRRQEPIDGIWQPATRFHCFRLYKHVPLRKGASLDLIASEAAIEAASHNSESCVVIMENPQRALRCLLKNF